MKSPSRREILAGSATALLALYFGRMRIAAAQGYNLGAFWKNATRVTVYTTQVTVRAVVADQSLQIQTTHALVRAVVLDESLQIQTTQAVVRALVADTALQIQTTQLVVKILVVQ